MSYAYSSLISKDKNMVVLMDSTYWGGIARNFYGVSLSIVLDYLEDIDWLEEHYFKIYGAVCNGLKGFIKSLNRDKV